MMARKTWLRLGLGAAAGAQLLWGCALAAAPGETAAPKPPAAAVEAPLETAQIMTPEGALYDLADGRRMLLTPDGRRVILTPQPAPRPAPAPVYVQPAPAPVYIQPAPAPEAVYARPSASSGVSLAAPVAQPTTGRGYVVTPRSGDFSLGRAVGDPAQAAQIQPSARENYGAMSTPSQEISMRAEPGAPVPPSIEYNIPHTAQEEPLWCWAAAAQQALGWVANGRQPTPAQCAVVAMAHGMDVNACCADRKGLCAKTGEIPEISMLVRRYGGQAASAPVPTDPRDLYRVLREGKTMLIRLRPTPDENAVGIRHMIVVRGLEWYRMPNGRLAANLLYNDPLGDDQRSVAYDEIKGFFEQALVVWR